MRPPWKRGRIEIYDSEKGVVAVETSTAAVVTDEPAKAPQENRASQVAENPAAGAEAKADETPFLGETAKVEQNNGGAADAAAGVMTDNVANAAAERTSQTDETAPVMLIPGAARQISGNVSEVQATGLAADVAAKDKPTIGAAVADEPKPAEKAAGVMTDKAAEAAAENPAEYDENVAPGNGGAIDMMKDIVARK